MRHYLRTQDKKTYHLPCYTLSLMMTKTLTKSVFLVRLPKSSFMLFLIHTFPVLTFLLWYIITIILFHVHLYVWKEAVYK